MPNNLEELRQRFEEHLRYVDEVVLVVLKGHLIIEEMLDSIISKFVFNPEFLEAANLRFAQKVSVARSISLDEHNNEMWQLAVTLNTLRNELAHSLTSSKRAAKTEAVIELYFRLAADIPKSEELRGQPEHIVISSAIAFFLGFLSSFQAEIDRFRESVDALDQAMNPHRHDHNGGRT